MKLVVTGGNTPELYNVEADPAERRTIDATHTDLTDQLKKELEEWLATESDAAKQKRQPRKADAGE